ncbi:MAG: LapA family protein [Pseudomonadota bacterium]
MFKYLRYLVLLAIAIVLIVVSLANLAPVTLNTLPSGLSGMPGLSVLSYQIELPLFLVIFGGIVVGVTIGYIWEWVREHKHRSAMRSGNRENASLKREVTRLKDEKNEGKDEVLALLDNAR